MYNTQVNPTTSYNNNLFNQPSINHYSKINTQQFANGMPISENGITQIEHSSRQFNNLKPNFMKNVYSPSLAPSAGSTTESFLKAKTSYSSNFRQNEKATRYQMISQQDLKLYNMQKSIDLYI